MLYEDLTAKALEACFADGATVININSKLSSTADITQAARLFRSS